MASEEPSDRNGLVEMVVESVRVHMLSSRHVVILKESEHDRYLPIWIGPWEASAIAMKLQGLTADRPLTHDLFASALENLGVRVDRVVISTLAEETYHARLHLERDGTVFEIDSRPSDALALAVRTGGRIFASEAVLEQAALGGDGTATGDAEAGDVVSEGSPLESTGEKIVDPRLDVFRDFVNSLDVDPNTGEGRTRSSDS
jgi:bifunctional DNase/RNase